MSKACRRNVGACDKTVLCKSAFRYNSTHPDRRGFSNTVIGWSLRVCPGVEEPEQWYGDKRYLPSSPLARHTQKITPVRRYVAIYKAKYLVTAYTGSHFHQYKQEKVAMMFERFTSFALLVFGFFSNTWLVSSALKGKL